MVFFTHISDKYTEIKLWIDVSLYDLSFHLIIIKRSILGTFRLSKLSIWEAGPEFLLLKALNFISFLKKKTVVLTCK